MTKAAIKVNSNQEKKDNESRRQLPFYVKTATYSIFNDLISVPFQDYYQHC